MKQVSIKNLSLNVGSKVVRYKDENSKDVMCPKFIKEYFGFKEEPKFIKKMYFVKNLKGLISLHKIEEELLPPYTSWSAEGIDSDWDYTNSDIVYVEGMLINTQGICIELSSMLFKLFERGEDHIKVDVYIEGWK